MEVFAFDNAQKTRFRGEGPPAPARRREVTKLWDRTPAMIGNNSREHEPRAGGWRGGQGAPADRSVSAQLNRARFAEPGSHR
jgi:hypothetical protein